MLVSVVVPVYNVERYLCKCVDSLLQQTYSDLEIILVNDGSPDKCGTICDAYMSKYKHIKVLHQENQGVSVARNNGAKLARGEYIAFVDPDDYVHKDYIKFLAEMAQKTDAEIVAVPSMNVTETQEINCQEEIALQEIVIYDTQKEKLEALFYAKGFGYAPWAKIFSRRLIERNPYPPELRIAEDAVATFHCVLDTNKVAVCKTKPLYYCVQRKGSATHSGVNIEYLKMRMKPLNEQLQYVRLNCPELTSGIVYRIGLGIVSDVANMMWNNQNDKAIFMQLQQELKPYLSTILQNPNLAIGFKVRCITVCMGYLPTKILWKMVDKIKGRTPA